MNDNSDTFTSRFPIGAQVMVKTEAYTWMRGVVIERLPNNRFMVDIGLLRTYNMPLGKLRPFNPRV